MKKRHLVEFDYWINNTKKVKVYAKALKVNCYGAQGLKLHIVDKDDTRVALHQETMDEIEAEANELLYEQSQDNELNFEE